MEHSSLDVIPMDELIPTHNELRNPIWLLKILNNNWAVALDKPTILRTEDGRNYILDGHHRLVLHSVLGITELKYYHLVQYTYKEMNEINFDCGYVTPFDPTKECRNSNFMLFKKTVMAMREDKVALDIDLRKFIRENKSLYVEPRKVECLHDLYGNIQIDGLKRLDKRC